MKVIQIITPNPPAQIIECMEKVKAIYPQVEVITLPETDRPIYESDKLRWQYMLEHDDILYIDWDCYPKKELVFEQNRLPSFLYYKGQPDTCLMYSPDRRWFQKAEAARIERGISTETIAWYRKVLRDRKANKISDDDVVHLRTSGMEVLRRNYVSVKVEQ